jgi:hypothetical protein
VVTADGVDDEDEEEEEEEDVVVAGALAVTFDEVQPVAGSLPVAIWTEIVANSARNAAVAAVATRRRSRRVRARRALAFSATAARRSSGVAGGGVESGMSRVSPGVVRAA